MTNPTSELLPCPFCGGEGEMSFSKRPVAPLQIVCKNCGANTYPDKWNKRAFMAAPEKPEGMRSTEIEIELAAIRSEAYGEGYMRGYKDGINGVDNDPKNRQCGAGRGGETM